MAEYGRWIRWVAVELSRWFGWRRLARRSRRYCTICGAASSADATFCRSCGRVLEIPRSPVGTDLLRALRRRAEPRRLLLPDLRRATVQGRTGQGGARSAPAAADASAGQSPATGRPSSSRSGRVAEHLDQGPLVPLHRLLARSARLVRLGPRLHHGGRRANWASTCSTRSPSWSRSSPEPRRMRLRRQADGSTVAASEVETEQLPVQDAGDSTSASSAGGSAWSGSCIAWAMILMILPIPVAMWMYDRAAARHHPRAVISPEGRGAAMRLIDLSLPIRPHFRWPTEVYQIERYERGFRTTGARIVAHGFTHVDSPLHLVPDTATINEVPARAALRSGGGRRPLRHVGDRQPRSRPPTSTARARTFSRATSSCSGPTSGPATPRRPPTFWDKAPYLSREAAEWFLPRRPKAVGYDFPQDYVIREMRRPSSRRRGVRRAPDLPEEQHPQRRVPDEPRPDHSPAGDRSTSCRSSSRPPRARPLARSRSRTDVPTSDSPARRRPGRIACSVVVGAF